MKGKFGEWIPCSAGMPEDLQEVAVTFLNHDPVYYYKNIKDVPMTAFAVYFKNKWYWWTSTAKDFLSEYGDFPMYLIDDSIEITAWMPMPEPYKGGNK